jgi:hypothetical protein
MHLHKGVQRWDKDIETLAMPDHKIIVFLEVLRLLLGQELKLKVLLTCVVKAAVQEASKKG